MQICLIVTFNVNLHKIDRSCKITRRFNPAPKLGLEMLSSMTVSMKQIEFLDKLHVKFHCTHKNMF